MKTKKFEKKLLLNKNTVAHLQVGAMEEVKGGDTTGCGSSSPILCDHNCQTDWYDCPSAPWTNCTAC